MGFFSWLFCSILVVALVLLLFPFSVRIEFEAGERGARALFFFFKKKVYECKKKWGLGGDDKCVDRESRPSSLGHDRDQHLGQERSDCPKTRDEKTEDVESRKSEVGSEENVKSSMKDEKSDDIQSDTTAPIKSETKSSEKKEQTAESPVKTETVEAGAVEAVAKHPEATTAEKKAMDPIEVRPLQDDYSEPAAKSELEEKNTADVKDAAKPALVSEPISSEPALKSEKAKSDDSKLDDSEISESEKPEKKKPKKEKRKLSDREFWTILLTPDLDARAFRYVLKILGAVFSLFRIRFYDCFVEGIQTDYQTMGYIAAVNGFLKAYPYVGDWDLRMDWCREKELRAAGTVRLSITLLRVFCFVLETLVLAGILAFSFWRRRARVIKTNELPELGFVRKKILNIILED